MPVLPKMPKVENLQSIFTSPFFTMFPEEILPTIEQRAQILLPGMSPGGRTYQRVRFDGSDMDLKQYLDLFGAFLGDGMTCGIDTGIGHTEAGEDVLARIDPINCEVGHGQYRLKQYAAQAKFYFLSPALREALDHTDLKWVDLQAFADLPPLLGLRLTGFKMKVNNEVHDCSDFLLVKDTTPLTRRKALEDHDVPKEFHDSAIVFHWLTSSRDELDQGLQSQTFGSFVLHQNLKLDEILETIDAWSMRETARVKREAEQYGLLDKVQEVSRGIATNPDSTADEIRMTRDHAEFLTNTLNQASWDEENRIWYGDVLRFVFKFVLLLSAEKVRIKPLLPPGVKDRANPSRKAKKIMDKLWKDWGRRYLVDVPADFREQSAEDRKSPDRHLVRGHFKGQHYGPGNSLRKIIWRCPFWRGTTELGQD